MGNLAGMLHISRKAGKVLLGKTAVLGRINAGKAVYILVASDCGENIKRKLSHLRYQEVDMTSAEIGEIFGRDRLSLLGITDDGLAAAIGKLIGDRRAESSGPAGRILN